MKQTDGELATSYKRPLRQSLLLYIFSYIYNKAYRIRKRYCRITIKFAIFASIWRIPKCWKNDRREHDT